MALSALSTHTPKILNNLLPLNHFLGKKHFEDESKSINDYSKQKIGTFVLRFLAEMFLTFVIPVIPIIFVLIPLIGFALILPFVALPTLVTLYDHKQLSEGRLIPERTWIIQNCSLQKIFNVSAPRDSVDEKLSQDIGEEKTTTRFFNALLITRHAFGSKHFNANDSTTARVVKAVLYPFRLLLELCVVLPLIMAAIGLFLSALSFVLLPEAVCLASFYSHFLGDKKSWLVEKLGIQSWGQCPDQVEEIEE